MNQVSVPLRVAAVAALLSVLATACNGQEMLTLTADFDDVRNMHTNQPVLTSDVEIGQVTAIELADDYRARVTMKVEPNTGLPSRVRAVVTQESLLGQRVVELLPVNDSGQLASGRIEQTGVKTDLENVVDSGSKLLGFVAADRLNQAVQAGAITFAGRGSALGQAITDVETFVGTFDRRSETITGLLDNLDSYLGTLAEASEANAAAIEALARSNQALNEEDERLLDALEDARRLAVVGERILRDNRQSLEEFFAQLEVITKSIVGVDGALAGLLKYLPRHNLHVPNAQLREFVQIWQDTIVCGTSAEQPDNPAKSCNPPNPGETNRKPDFWEAERCDEDHVDCEGYPEGVQPRTGNEPNDFGDDASQDSEPDRSERDPDAGRPGDQ